jgi:hypothetical protein
MHIMTEIDGSLPHLFTDKDKSERLATLRREVNQQIEEETQERIRTNPVPTETEIELGAFVEMLEPQVRDALIQMHSKGYNTESSGFGGQYSNLQVIEGFFSLGDRTKAQLEAQGVEVKSTRLFSHPYTDIVFQPKEPDLAKIKKKWDTVAALLPDKGQPALPSTTDGAVEFRKRFAPHSPYLEEWQAHILDTPQPKNNPKTTVWILVTVILTTI